jgi:hypothetical protein
MRLEWIWCVDAFSGGLIVLIKRLGCSKFKTTLNNYEHYGIDYILPHRNQVSVGPDFGGVPAL